MEALKEEPKQQPIEPQFLSQAQANGIKVRIGQMNKTEHEGIIRDIGRYEINLEENGRLVTLLKQEISYLSAETPLLLMSASQHPVGADEQAAQGAQPRPNIQQDFLDKAIKEHHHLTLFLLNGQRVRAVIEGYDNFTILLREGGRQHLYYKHSITTINR